MAGEAQLPPIMARARRQGPSPLALLAGQVGEVIGRLIAAEAQIVALQAELAVLRSKAKE